MAVFKVIEGWTGPLDFQLKADGAVPAGTLAGMTVTLVLVDANGAAVDMTGKIAVTDAANWKVRYNPAGPDLVFAKGPYLARWKVTDGAGKVVFFPNDEADVWQVFKP
jgi:hypothetical protein